MIWQEQSDVVVFVYVALNFLAQDSWGLRLIVVLKGDEISENICIESTQQF